MRPVWMESTKLLLDGLISNDLELNVSRDHLFLVLEELNRRSRLWILPSICRNAILRHGGLDILKGAITRYVKDEILVTVCMRLLASLLLEKGIDVRLAMHGFKGTLQIVVDHYTSVGDRFIQTDAQQILNSVSRAENRVATEDIRYVLQ
jgi:hypothetical protein